MDLIFSYKIYLSNKLIKTDKIRFCEKVLPYTFIALITICYYLPIFSGKVIFYFNLILLEKKNLLTLKNNSICNQNYVIVNIGSCAFGELPT